MNFNLLFLFFGLKSVDMLHVFDFNLLQFHVWEVLFIIYAIPNDLKTNPSESINVYAFRFKIYPVATNNSFCLFIFFFGLWRVPAISMSKVAMVVNVDRTTTPCWLLTLVVSRPSRFFIRLKGLSQFFLISMACWDAV